MFAVGLCEASQVCPFEYGKKSLLEAQEETSNKLNVFFQFLALISAIRSQMGRQGLFFLSTFVSPTILCREPTSVSGVAPTTFEGRSTD